MSDKTERTPRRPGGRPKSDEPRTTVSTWLPARYHDRLISVANSRGQSVSETVKQLIIQRLG